MQKVEVSRSTGRTVKLSPTESNDYGAWVAFIAVGEQQGWGFKGLTPAELVEIRDWINGRLQELEPVNEDEEQEFSAPRRGLNDGCECPYKCGRTRLDVIEDSREFGKSNFVEADGSESIYVNGKLDETFPPGGLPF